MTDNIKRVQRIEIVDCQNMSDDEMAEVLEEISKSSDSEDGVIKLLMTSPAKATLTDKEGNDQHILLEVSHITDEECADLCECLGALCEEFPDLLVELRRTKSEPFRVVATEEQESSETDVIEENS